MYTVGSAFYSQSIHKITELNFQFTILQFCLQTSNNGGKCQRQFFILCVPVWERRLVGGGKKSLGKQVGGDNYFRLILTTSQTWWIDPSNILASLVMNPSIVLAKRSGGILNHWSLVPVKNRKGFLNQLRVQVVVFKIIPIPNSITTAFGREFGNGTSNDPLLHGLGFHDIRSVWG